MTTMRVKKPVKGEYLIETQRDFERIVGEITELKITQRTLQNDMDTALAAIRTKYEKELPAKETEIKKLLGLAQEYCDAHPDLFPKDRKSIEVLHAVVGYRTGTPAAKPLRGWTWSAIFEAIKARGWKKFIRVKEDVDKDALIAARDTHPLNKVGVEIKQIEAFFVDPKIEEQETRVTAGQS